MTDMALITVQVDAPEPDGIGFAVMQAILNDLRIIRHDVTNMSDAEKQQIGPEVILLLRDVAPHLTCTPIGEAVLTLASEVSE